ncbi:hypothetical protein C8R43DRAFT_1141762 [Mycena crocata]|nr:hypothetical protein C8R43DRAFT_1141762 [Mycena crocata]
MNASDAKKERLYFATGYGLIQCVKGPMSYANDRLAFLPFPFVYLYLRMRPIPCPCNITHGMAHLRFRAASVGSRPRLLNSISSTVFYPIQPVCPCPSLSPSLLPSFDLLAAIAHTKQGVLIASQHRKRPTLQAASPASSAVL